MRRADRPRPAALIGAAAALMLAATPALAQWREGPREGGRGGGRGEAAQERGPRGEGGWNNRAAGRSYEGARGGYESGRSYPSRAYESPAYQGQAYRGQELRAPELRERQLRSPPLRGQAYPDGAVPYGGYGAGRPAGGDGRAWRRGQVLPDGYRGATVPDPGRYHLRRAPNGYDWVGDNRNAYLMQRSTGMVLDSVPGAYDPPPPYQGRRRR